MPKPAMDNSINIFPEKMGHSRPITTKTSKQRVKKLKRTPIYVKPQVTSSAGTCRISVMVGIRNDPGKTVDSITLQFQLPPCVLSSDLSSNHGTVDILANKIGNLMFINISIGRIPKDKAPALTSTMVLEAGLDCLTFIDLQSLQRFSSTHTCWGISSEV